MARLKAHEKEMLQRVIRAKHIYGLPIAKGLEVYVYYEANGFLINFNDRIFGLGYDVVTDISVRTDQEIQSSYVSNAGGAVAGGMMFGPVGALIGGGPQRMTSTTFTEYLIITYIKNGELAYLCFELPNSSYFVTAGSIGGINNWARTKINYNARNSTVDLSKDSGIKMRPVESTYVPNVELGRNIKQLALRYERQMKKTFRNDVIIIVFIVIFAFFVLFVFALTANNVI